MKPYRSLSTLGTCATISILVCAAADLANTSVGMMQSDVDDMSLGGLAAYVGAAFAWLASIITSAVFFCMWLYRAAYNARALGHGPFETTPGFAVGSFFIPILNLWKPYQAMQDVWRASHATRSDSWLAIPTSDLVKGWWAAWLLANITGNVAMRNEGYNGLDLVSSVLTWLAAFLCIAMMRQVSAAQEAQYAANTSTVTIGDAVGHTPYGR